MTKELNNFQKDKFKLSFSSLPSIGSSNIDMELFHNNVRSLTIPSLEMEFLQSSFKRTILKTPISRVNDNFNPLMIDFLASENLTNYYYFYKYICDFRNGEVSDNKMNDYKIDSINVFLLDNQKRTKATLRFLDCILVSLSDLVLSFGDSDNVTNFACMFQYDSLELDI